MANRAAGQIATEWPNSHTLQCHRNRPASSGHNQRSASFGHGYSQHIRCTLAEADQPDFFLMAAIVIGEQMRCMQVSWRSPYHERHRGNESKWCTCRRCTTAMTNDRGHGRGRVPYCHCTDSTGHSTQVSSLGRIPMLSCFSQLPMLNCDWPV